MPKPKHINFECSKCYYFHPVVIETRGTPWGTCRATYPAIGNELFPSVNFSDWCAKYEPVLYNYDIVMGARVEEVKETTR